MEKLGQELLRRVDDGEDDTKAAELIIEQEKKVQNPQWNNFKEGDIIDLPDGRSAKVVGFFPDNEPDVEIIE